MNEIEWSPKQRDAQLLLAIGNLEKQEIAKTVGVSRSTLWEWEKKVGWKAEVDRVRRDTENFALTLYYNNLINAVNNIKDLGSNSTNDMVKLNANLEIINRILGKPSNNIKLSTEVDITKTVDQDVLEAEFAEFEQDNDGE